MRVEHSPWRLPQLDRKRFRHADLMAALDEGLGRHAAADRSVAGASAEGRPIQRVVVGTGPTTVLAWSQMHGNEPAGTMALCDLLHFLAASTHDIAQRIRAAVTLVALPMLNPDGTERFRRQNAQGLDLNRDALSLAAPESRVLITHFEDHQPAFALSLHDQEPRKRVGSSRRRTAYSLSAPPPDLVSGSTGSAAQERAKRIFADIRRELERHADGRLTRYQAPHEPLAFCDNFQSRGTATLLFEAAAWDNDPEKQYLRMLHFRALAAALHSIATRSWERADPDDYGTLPENGDDPLFDVLIRDAMVCAAGVPPFRADVAIDYDDPLEFSAPTVADLGDLRQRDGALELDARGLFLHVDASALDNGSLLPGCAARLVARTGSEADSPAVWRIEDGPVTFEAGGSESEEPATHAGR